MARNINMIIRDLERFSEKLTKRYADLLYDKLLDICEEVVSNFYDDYDLVSYHPYERTGDLYNTYKIDINTKDNKWSIEFSPDLMKYHHRASNDYIYELAFKEGYHGGGIPKKDTEINSGYYSGNTIKPKTPYWRTSYDDTYSNWGKPAKKSKSPYKEIIKRVNKEFKKLNKKMQTEYDEKMKKIIKELHTVLN